DRGRVGRARDVRPPAGERGARARPGDRGRRNGRGRRGTHRRVGRMGGLDRETKMNAKPHSDVIVTAPLPPFLYEPLKADYRCHDYVQATDKAAFLAGCGAMIRGLVQGGGTVTQTTLLDALPALEIISVFGVGYDGVPIDYCKKRGIKVTNTPDVLTDDVADVAVGLVLMTGRGFVQANRFVHAGDWLKRGAPLTTKLAGRTAGILGLGRIGK